jgi:hypothetical protein
MLARMTHSQVQSVNRSARQLLPEGRCARSQKERQMIRLKIMIWLMVYTAVLGVGVTAGAILLAS